MSDLTKMVEELGRAFDSQDRQWAERAAQAVYDKARAERIAAEQVSSDIEAVVALRNAKPGQKHDVVEIGVAERGELLAYIDTLKAERNQLLARAVIAERAAWLIWKMTGPSA